jgi:acetylornithine deacetylase
MKGGVAAALIAMTALRGVELSGPVELAALVDEEETGKGIRSYVESVDRQFMGCITAEPTDLQTIIGARGDSYLRVAIHGRASHAGNPADGANAIYGAAAVVAEIERLHHELAASPHPLLGPATWSVGQIDGGTGGSIVPAECVIVADRRLLPGESPTEVLAELKTRVEGLSLDQRGLTFDLEMPMEMPAFETSPSDPLVQATDSALRDAGGPGLPLGGWTAACDGGFIARDLGVPVVVLGPGSVTTQAHRPDESVAVAELLIAARTYALTALRLLGSDTA